MSKSKSSSKAAKPAKQDKDILTKVKDAAVTKPAQTVKAKAQELAKQVAGKEEKKDKKSKKKAKEPSPEPSESEESESSESSESESDEESRKPATNGKAKFAEKVASKEESGESSVESESEDDSASSSESETEASKANGKFPKQDTAKTTKKSSDEGDESESESDSDDSMADGASSDESSEEAGPVKKAAGKAVEAKKATKADSASASGSDSDSEDGDNSNSSDDSDAEEDDVAAKPTKRKAEDEAQQTVKKPRADPVTTSRGANLFVGNLSWNVDEAWLREVFEEYGELSGVRIMTDRESGRSKGFGYVEFVNPEDAAKAHAAKAGVELDGRAMNVDFANARPDNSQKQENRRKSYGDQVSEPSDTLFVGNLSFEVGQETVTEAFAPHGTILGIRLPTDRETGQPKGFGYVTFSSADEAKTAIEAMQGSYIEGRPVRLDFSAPRPQNGDSPARGRGGFGGFGGRGGPRGGARGGRGGRGGNFGGRGGRGGRGGSTNRGGFGDFSGKKTSFD